MKVEQLKPGQQVRISQEIDRREGAWTSQIVGTVVSVAPEQTGSWHAHGKGQKLWLHRVRLQREGGEQTTVVIDRHTLIEEIAGNTVRVIDPAPAVARQVERRLDAINARAMGNIRGQVHLFTSGDAARLASLLPKLGLENFPLEEIG